MAPVPIRFRRALAAALALAWASAPSGAGAQELHVDRTAANLVRFVSRAATEEFDGTTDRIDGYVLLDGPSLGPSTGEGTTSLYLEVELATLDTGIGLRNRHMRDNYLEVDRHPYAGFEGRIHRVEEAPDGGFAVTARGVLTIHGVARDRLLDCTVVPRGPGYRARCAFDVRLSDHDIPIPRLMFLRLSNEIRVELDFTVRPAEGARD